MCRPFSPGRLSSPSLDSAPKLHGCRPSVRGDRALGRLIILPHLTFFLPHLPQHLFPHWGQRKSLSALRPHCHMHGSCMFRHSYSFLSSAHPSAYPRNFRQSRRLCSCSLPNSLPYQQRDSSRLLSGLARTERCLLTGTLHLSLRYIRFQRLLGRQSNMTERRPGAPAGSKRCQDTPSQGLQKQTERSRKRCMTMKSALK